MSTNVACISNQIKKLVSTMDGKIAAKDALDEAKKKEIINHWKRAIHKDAKFTVESIPEEKDGDLKITIEFPEPLIEEDHGYGHPGGRITEALGFAGIPGRIKEVYVHKVVALDWLYGYYPNSEVKAK